ncbi:uncharacterized protein LOC134533858 [Bacillus rossius redtenbacheri]|uniref:uncharacterized protein LOC134533858 n=1 Tax=Bacillus rossius redtenbacheri TaxID=93214 RepID=UPI002FDD845B
MTSLGEFGSRTFLMGDSTMMGRVYRSPVPIKNRNTAIAFKIVQLSLLALCIILYSMGAYLENSMFRLALSYGTFGAYLMIPLAVLGGFIIGENTPVLLTFYNLAGAFLFIAVGSLAVDSWWGLQMTLDITSRSADVSAAQHDSNMKLVAGMICISNGVFYFVDALVGAFLLNSNF